MMAWGDVFYLVPTYRDFAVLPPAHFDQESPETGFHLHIDRRFEAVPPGWAFIDLEPEPVIRWRLKLPVSIPSPFRIQEIEALEIFHRSCRVGADGRCPHQGLPVDAGRLLADGSRLCPGHGLRWAADGSLIAGDAAERGLWSCGIRKAAADLQRSYLDEAKSS